MLRICPIVPLKRRFLFSASKRWKSALVAVAATNCGILLAPSSTCHAFVQSPFLTTRLNIHTRRFATKQSPDEEQMTRDALSIVKQAIAAVDPYTAVETHMEPTNDTSFVVKGKEFRQNDYDSIVLVSFGKASSAMATAAAERLQECMPTLDIHGVVICKDGHATQQEVFILTQNGVFIQEASHPVPDERSVIGANKIVDVLQHHASNRTLVICCISGGGSALCCAPKPPLSLKDLQDTNQALLKSGLSIQDMNVIRKRLEQTKGGRLAQAAYPSTVLTLVLSDILGDPLDLIASGPTVQDTSTYSDALNLIQQHESLQTSLPEAVVKLIEQGAESNETIPPEAFDKCKTVLVGNNELAVTAAAQQAKQLGYNPVVLSTRVQGETRHVAGVYTAMAHQLSLQRNNNNTASPYPMAPLPVAMIAGGETTVTLPSDDTLAGKGGRNQELALAAALELKELELRNVVLASVGTDGTDGPTDAAGAVVDGTTVDRYGVEEAVRALQRHDAYTYFSKEGVDGPLVMTGPTGTNVADVCVVLVR